MNEILISSDVAVFGTARPTEGAFLIPELVPPAVADAFVRMLWKDLINGRALTQTHQDGILLRNALEIHGRNYPPLLALHWGLTSIVAARLKARLLPTFSYFRLYFQKDICRVHSDRPACEVSASVTLAYSDLEPWDLSIASTPAADTLAITDHFNDEKFATFRMRVGDAVVYSGSTFRHGRITPNPNRWSAHLFLQWVNEDGPHKGEAFERLDLDKLPAVSI